MRQAGWIIDRNGPAGTERKVTEKNEWQSDAVASAFGVPSNDLKSVCEGYWERQREGETLPNVPTVYVLGANLYIVRERN